MARKHKPRSQLNKEQGVLRHLKQHHLQLRLLGGKVQGLREARYALYNKIKELESAQIAFCCHHLYTELHNCRKQLCNKKLQLKSNHGTYIIALHQFRHRQYWIQHLESQQCVPLSNLGEEIKKQNRDLMPKWA